MAYRKQEVLTEVEEPAPRPPIAGLVVLVVLAAVAIAGGAISWFAWGYYDWIYAVVTLPLFGVVAGLGWMRRRLRARQVRQALLRMDRER